MLRRESCHAQVFGYQFLKFPIIPDFSSRRDQNSKERLSVFRWCWSGCVLRCARAGFNSLLWIKYLTKLKLAHFFYHRLGWALAHCRHAHQLGVDTSSVPLSTAPNLEKYFQKGASMQGEGSHENLLVLMNPDFLTENHFLFSSRRIANSSRQDTGFV